MEKKTPSRLGISFSPADMLMLRKAQKRLEAEHGKLTTTAVIRMAVRRLAQS